VLFCQHTAAPFRLPRQTQRTRQCSRCYHPSPPSTPPRTATFTGWAHTLAPQFFYCGTSFTAAILPGSCSLFSHRCPAWRVPFLPSSHPQTPPPTYLPASWFTRYLRAFTHAGVPGNLCARQPTPRTAHATAHAHFITYRRFLAPLPSRLSGCSPPLRLPHLMGGFFMNAAPSTAPTAATPLPHLRFLSPLPPVNVVRTPRNAPRHRFAAKHDCLACLLPS